MWVRKRIFKINFVIKCCKLCKVTLVGCFFFLDMSFLFFWHGFSTGSKHTSSEFTCETLQNPRQSFWTSPAFQKSSHVLHTRGVLRLMCTKRVFSRPEKSVGYDLFSSLVYFEVLFFFHVLFYKRSLAPVLAESLKYQGNQKRSETVTSQKIEAEQQRGKRIFSDLCRASVCCFPQTCVL